MQPSSVILFGVSFSGPDILSRYDGRLWADWRWEVGSIETSPYWYTEYIGVKSTRPTKELQLQLSVCGWKYLAESLH